jgi:CheY-like chemotaxis protein
MPETNLVGISVLVVDDHEDCRSLLTSILETCGAIVRTCESAQEAIKTVIECRPDVIISDICMPIHDGHWLIKNVRQLHPEQVGQTPAIALSARSAPEDRRRALDAGFQVHIGKPFEAEQIVESVRTLITVSSTGPNRETGP